MKRFFVTGGAGFIGSAFIRLLLKRQDEIEVINFDALTYAGNPENLADINDPRYLFVHGNICDQEAVLRALPESVDAVFNFAAESHVDRSIHSADEFLKTNVLGTQVLLDCARQKNARRFVQISTDEVMGSLPEDEAAFFTEESPYQPNSPYAASKAAAEMMVRAARETFGLDTVVTRCGNNYGPRQFPEKLIPLMISNLLNDEMVPVYGDGMNVRDWIYVDDHCRAIYLAYENGLPGSVYNIGARNAIPNLSVVRSVLGALGRSESMIRFVEDRLGHDRRYAIDPGKTESELGWSPETSWEEGILKTVEWYKENRDWAERIRNGEYRNYYKKQYGVEVGG